MNGSFDFSTGFNKAWDAYKNNLLLVVGASLVASILISITCGILTGPILAGLLTLMLKLIDKKPGATFEDIFSRFDIFLTTFLLCLVWGVAVYMVSMILIVVPVLGWMASVLLSVAFSVFLFFAILQVAEKNMGFGDASRSAFEMLKQNFWPLIGFSIVASLVSGIGAIACGIGAIFTMPMLYLMLAAAYRGCSVDPVIDVTAETVEVIEEPSAELAPAEEEPMPEESAEEPPAPPTTD